MNLKNSLIATTIWMVLVIAAGIAIIAYILNNPIPGMSNDERAAMVGGGLGILAGIGLAIIWLPFAARLGKERRAAKQKAARRRKR